MINFMHTVHTVSAYVQAAQTGGTFCCFPCMMVEPIITTEPSRMTLWAYIGFVVLYLQSHNTLASQEVVMAAMNSNEDHGEAIDISTDWEVLGPFQIGTRGMHSSLRASR